MVKNNEFEYIETDAKGMKMKVYAKLNGIIRRKGISNAFFDDEKYQAMIEHVDEIKSG